MSTVSIIRADHMVVVDGRALPVDLSALDPAIHAVQWAGEAGHVEYCYGTGVVPLASLSEYGWVLAAWEAARDEADAPGPPEPTLEEAKATAHARVQTEKARVRDAGFMVGEVLFDSDLSARMAYMELAMRLQAEPTYATNWKASDGVWVTMDAALFAQVHAAGAALIGAVFAWQEGRDAEIDAAETVEAVQAISTEYGEE